MTEIRTSPCNACPYRCDVPSGVWAASEYDKLRDYDAPTPFQPAAGFSCHATPELDCHGWAVVGSNRPGHDLLALRLHPPTNGIPEPVVPLFASHCEAANHGQADVEHPGAEAIAAVERLVRKHPRLTGSDR